MNNSFPVVLQIVYEPRASFTSVFNDLGSRIFCYYVISVLEITLLRVMKSWRARLKCCGRLVKQQKIN